MCGRPIHGVAIKTWLAHQHRDNGLRQGVPASHTVSGLLQHCIGSATLKVGRGLVLGVVLLAATGGSACVRRPPSVPDGVPGGLTSTASVVQVRIGETGKPTRAVALEDYVGGVLLAELPLASLVGSAAGRTMTAVQAIVARTYALTNLGRHADAGFDLCVTTHCQLYRPPETSMPTFAALAAEATMRTRSMVITHNHRPIQALFHANCGGGTSSAGSVWGGPTPPYLNGAPDLFCTIASPKSWHSELEETELRDALNQNDRTSVGSHLRGIEVLRRDGTGRAVSVRLDGKRDPIVRGEELRAALTSVFGPRSFKSTRFQVRRVGGTFRFEGTGYGHGVGLCQTGAIARAEAGHTPDQILQHYYPGTGLELASAETSPRRPSL